MKPIFFNTEMVRAILDGRKTTTRRVLKPKYKDDEYGFEILTNRHTGQLLRVEKTDESGDTFDDMRVISPPHQPGDILYVRETWERLECCCCEGDFTGECFNTPDDKDGCYVYKASHEITGDARWCPSIHMPKEAARLFLRVTDVRIERLQNIDNEGARAEGCDGRCSEPHDGALSDWIQEYDFSVEKFITTWDSTIKKSVLDRYGWNANPWVWVFELKKISKEEALNEKRDA